MGEEGARGAGRGSRAGRGAHRGRAGEGVAPGQPGPGGWGERPHGRGPGPAAAEAGSAARPRPCLLRDELALPEPSGPSLTRSHPVSPRSARAAPLLPFIPACPLPRPKTSREESQALPGRPRPPSACSAHPGTLTGAVPYPVSKPAGKKGAGKAAALGPSRPPSSLTLSRGWGLRARPQFPRLYDWGLGTWSPVLVVGAGLRSLLQEPSAVAWGPPPPLPAPNPVSACHPSWLGR